MSFEFRELSPTLVVTELWQELPVLKAGSKNNNLKRFGVFFLMLNFFNCDAREGSTAWEV